MKKKFAIVLVLGLILALAAFTSVFAAGAWSDNFDSYPTGQDLHGVGGWKGWSNDPTYTAFTTDVQARSAPNSVDIVSNSDLVHEYSNTSGLWCYRFYQYIPGNLVGQSYFIMLNQYDDAGVTNNWSVQVIHDGATGMMTDTGVSGATMAYVADQWVEVTLEIDLTLDTQVYTYNGTLFYTGTWSQHVSGGGIPAIGAVDLFANGSSSVYYDDMELVQGDCSGPTPTATAPAPTDTPIPPTDTPPAPTSTSPAATSTSPAATSTSPAATSTAPAATSTAPATDVELSTFGGNSSTNILPFAIGAILVVVALGWYVSKRREA